MADNSASKQERWQRTDELLDSALAQPPETRAAFLARACGDDDSLRQEVESLLKHHALAENFLEGSPGDIAADMLDNGQARLKQGQLIDHYKILSLLGVGGMGEVYLAQDTRLGRQVALKMLPAQFTKDEETAHRFEQEARAASALNHPNIIVIHQIGQVAEQLHIVTEYIDGQTLRLRLAGTPLRLAETLDIAVQVASALDAAHRAGIVHRDIKPENIMLRPDGVVKVLDFGVAKLIDVQGTAQDSNAATVGDFKTGAGMVMGTAQYMSPEQVRGQKIDPRADIWSLGVVIYEMVTNVTPFGGETPNHALVAVLEKEPEPLKRYSEGAPAELERIVYKALQKNREERYQTIKDLALDLKNLKQELEVEARLRRSAGQPAGDPVAGVKRAVKTDSRAAISSADVVREIKSRKRGVLAFLAALVIAAASIAYFIQGGTPIESVAILPFPVTAGGDPNTEYLAAGIPEDIANSLTQLPQLTVVAGHLVADYKGSEDPRNIGLELGVRAVLKGNVVQRGEIVEIGVSLLDTKDGELLWGDKYSFDLKKDLVAKEEQITSDVSQALLLQLTGSENSASHRDYLQGRYLLRQNGDVSHERAKAYFISAIEKDKNNALAWAGLSDYYGLAANLGVLVPNEAWLLAERAATTALGLDDTLGEVHVALGAVRMFYHRDWTGAENHFKIALKLAPNFRDTYSPYLRLLRVTGRYDEALSEIQKGSKVAPNVVLARTGVTPGIIYYLQGRNDEAIEEFKKDPTGEATTLGAIYAQQGKLKECLSTIRPVEIRTRNNPTGRA